MNESLAFDESNATKAQLEAEIDQMLRTADRMLEEIRRDQQETTRLGAETRVILDWLERRTSRRGAAEPSAL